MCKDKVQEPGKKPLCLKKYKECKGCKKVEKKVLKSFQELEQINFADLYCDCNNVTISDADNGL
jgi:hypothetical protein